MPVSSTHKLYDKRVRNWRSIRDSIEGESAIKAAEDVYLPRPPGMTGGSADHRRFGEDRYSFYLEGAEFPEIIGPSLDGIQGLIHEKPIEVEFPSKMEYLLKDATQDGEDINTLWERITREVFATGRMNLLHDIGADDQIRFCTYTAEAMINWRLSSKRMGSEAQLVVLKEEVSEEKTDDPFENDIVIYYRELRMSGDIYTLRRWRQAGETEVVPVVDLEEGSPTQTDSDGWMVPSLFGRNFGRIPINPINATGEGFLYGPIPLMPMVRRALSIYRKTADYNRSLYVKADPQPVIFGVDQDELPKAIGGDSVWHFTDPLARVEYLDIDGLGIPLLRQAIEDEYIRFDKEGGKLRENDSGPESGEAVKRRQMIKQVTSKSVVITAGMQFEQALKDVGRSMAMSEAEIESITAKPNLDWAEPDMQPSEFGSLADTKLKGAPLAWKTVHRLANLHGITDLTYDEEMEEINRELMEGEGRAPAEPIDPEAEE